MDTELLAGQVVAEGLVAFSRTPFSKICWDCPECIRNPGPCPWELAKLSLVPFADIPCLILKNPIIGVLNEKKMILNYENSSLSMDTTS